MKNEIHVIQVNDINVGENIKRIRLNRELKQTEVITKLQLLGIEISVYSYSKIENGKQNPTVSLLLGLIKIFDCDFNDLFESL